MTTYQMFWFQKCQTKRNKKSEKLSAVKEEYDGLHSEIQVDIIFDLWRLLFPRKCTCHINIILNLFICGVVQFARKYTSSFTFLNFKL